MTYMLHRAAARWTLFAFALLFAACSPGSDAQTITVKDLKSLLAQKERPIVLDVRTAEELKGPLGALDGVIHIPVQELDRRMDELSKHKDKNIYIICRTQNRSGVARRMMSEKGYKVTNVDGGMVAWRNEFGTANK